MKRNSFKATLFSMAIMAVIGFSCSNEQTTGGDDTVDDEDFVNMVYPKKTIDLTPEQWQMVTANNAFAFDFFRQVNAFDGEKNSFCSPQSLTYMLGMLCTGADGETRQQMMDVLHLGNYDVAAVNDFCANLMKSAPLIDPKVTLSIANSIYVNNRIGTILPAFDNAMKQFYEADIEALNFTSPSALSHINGWCKEKTNGMIPTILDQIDPSCVMYLLNAIYFKADWAKKFNEKNTKNVDFIMPSGAKKQLPMMHQKVRVRYGSNSNYSAISLPYGEGAFCMLLLLPNEGKTVDDVIDALKPADLKECTDRIADVDVKVPRFVSETEIDLMKIMPKMGMQKAFDENFAEFPWMVKEGGLYVSKMLQKAKIEVNEKGSEAAAVTISGMAYGTSVGPSETFVEKHDFHADRPFVYLITERGSDAVFFIGKFTGED